MFKCMSFAKCSRHIESIDKRHQNLTSFPDDVVRYYRTLEELLLDSNQLQDLPKGFYKLTQLRKLDISDNEIEKLSPEIGNLINLIVFCCNRNDLQEIPESIKYCKNIQVLDLSNNPLQNLPNSLTQLKGMVELTLNDLSLSNLPDDIGNLINLKSLQSRDNLFKKIPNSLFDLSKLEVLDLGSNEIEDLPDLIGNLINLKELWLDLNQIKKIPVEIGYLKRLQYIELSENLIEMLPEEISGCLSLTDLNLTQNNIEYLPSSIGVLESLHILKVEHNQLVILTQNIGKCRNLSELVLTENLLTEIPSSIGNLKILTNLNLDRNRISLLPNEICECENLGLLSLRDNQLHVLPDNLGNLKKLKVLDVAGNKLSFLPSSLMNTYISAIWLAENQATGNIKLQSEYNEELHKDILTCYLLPQQNFHTPSMENLLHGSIYTVNSSHNGSTHDSNKIKKGADKAGESVKFVSDSDNDEKTSTFIRTNTPHPKELSKKKEILKQKTMNHKSHSANKMSVDSGGISVKSDNSVEDNKLNEINAINKNEINQFEKQKNLQFGSNDLELSNIDENNISRTTSNNSFHEKHVGFTINNEADVEQNDGVCRLRRHDTPHYLKSARINNKAQIGTDELKEILQRYSATTSHLNYQNTVKNNTHESLIKKNDNYDIIKLNIYLTKAPEDRFGFNLMPSFNDEELYIDGILVETVDKNSTAFRSGLMAGDKIVKANCVDLLNISKQEVVKILNNDSLEMIVEQKLNFNKIYFINLSNEPEINLFSFSLKYEDLTSNFVIIDVIQVSNHDLKPFDILLQINNVKVSKNIISKYFLEINDVEFQYNENNSFLNKITNITVYRPNNETTINNKILHQNDNSRTMDSDSVNYKNLSILNEKDCQSDYAIEDIKIIKINGAMGLSIVGGGSVPCHPFGIEKPGIFISKIAHDGAASRTNLRIGDRILKVNGIDITEASHDDTVEELKRLYNEVVLTVKHEPQPIGLMDICITKSYPDESLGIRIHGGIENKSANPYDSSDEGIFVVDIISDTIADKDNRLKIGTRIIEVNGQSLLGVKLTDAQSYLTIPNEKIQMVVCDGFKNSISEKLTSNNMPFPLCSLESKLDKKFQTNTNNFNYDNLRTISNNSEQLSTNLSSFVSNVNKKNKINSDVSESTSEKIIYDFMKQKSKNETNNRDDNDINDPARSFKDKMKFFEAAKDRNSYIKERRKFSYLQDHEIQNLKQEEEKKLQILNQDQKTQCSNFEIVDITTHRDYATFFSNSLDVIDSVVRSHVDNQKN